MPAVPAVTEEKAVDDVLGVGIFVVDRNDGGNFGGGGFWNEIHELASGSVFASGSSETLSVVAVTPPDDNRSPSCCGSAKRQQRRLWPVEWFFLYFYAVAELRPRTGTDKQRQFANERPGTYNGLDVIKASFIWSTSDHTRGKAAAAISKADLRDGAGSKGTIKC
jgi:hypothetical protein